MQRQPLYQRKLTDKKLAGTTVVHNIEAVGDPLQTKQEGTPRIAFQNIHGATDAQKAAIPSEIEAMEELQIDIMGMAETNRPWTNEQQAYYNAEMNKTFRGSQTLYTAAPTTSHTTRYQPGGNLLTVNGEVTARIDGRGTDKWGRFCWYQLKGRRDEGVIVIVAYRVCQEKLTNTGPYTAFRQQHIAMRAENILEPNPRKQILTDLEILIREKRARGYRPILLIDANGDYLQGKDNDLKNFLNNSSLCDPYSDRFTDPIRTYLHGPNRIDYIFMDMALTTAITSIGYLGTHDGAISDHVLAYVDMNHSQIFAGLINRPPPAHLRDILIEQEDKVQAFLRLIHPQLDAQNYAERVFELAQDFAKHSATQPNIDRYNNMYTQLLEIIQGVTKQVGKKPIGYLRSRTLTTAGNHVLLSRYLFDCKTRGTPPTRKLLRLGERLSVDVIALLELPEQDLRRLMRSNRKHLWECQKNCASLREEFLELEAQKRAAATGDKDWQARVRKMKRKIKITAMNRKLTAITKGPRGALKMIQVPTHDWFYSELSNELFHYHKGVFEAFPATEVNLFHSHHTRKVLPPEAQAVQVGRNDTDTHWIITNIIPNPTNLWREITNTEEIEAELLQRNQMHLEQTAREEGISTLPPLTILRENHGYNDMSRRVLNGIEVTEFSLTPEIAAYFQTLKQSEQEATLTPILGSISSIELQEMFKIARERTSSDPRTPNYTIWKCLARSDKIAGFLSVLFSLPFIYGFANAHWSQMTDFMLEKKPGVRHIHLLRIIGKVPAEFNTCLKLLIGKQARDNFKATDTCDEQHGFRPNRSAPDAMMIKMLTAESARMQKYTFGIIQHDMTAHFDRMQPEMTAITATKYGVSENLMTSIGKTIAGLRRNVETSLGISSGTYGQTSGAPRLGGMVQGKADVPQLATQQSDIMLKAHKSLTYGVNITSPGLHRRIQHHSVAFADDTEGQVSCETSENTLIPRVIGRLQHSGQTWSNLANVCGSLIAHHKCSWQFLAWEMKAGHLQPRIDLNEQLLLHDGKGSQVAIKYLTPDEPNVGLGFNLCISGNQIPHYDSIIQKISALCKTVATAHMTETETRSLLKQRLLPKLSYLLHGTSLTKTHCHSINKIFKPVLVPMLRLNRNYPTAILHGPIDYGGMEFPDAYTLQDQIQLDYLIKQLRWDKAVANTFLVTLDTVQLCSGFTSPILENTHGEITYLQPSYITTLRHRLHDIQATLWIEKKWTPTLQRTGDKSIMEAILELPGITRAKLRQVNAVRLYMRVITIADITDVGGTFIPAGQLDGEWQAGSDIKWPYQPSPPPVFWRTFRSCIRLAFCSRTPPHQRTHHSMFLDYPLGKWLPVHRNTWYDAYRAQDAIYWRRHDDEQLDIMTESPTPGVYTLTDTTTTPPVDSYPIQHIEQGNEIWTTMDNEMIQLQPVTEQQPSGLIITDQLKPQTNGQLTLASDGSAHLHHNLASCAWIIHQEDGHELKANYFIQNISSLSSYRSELEGIFRGLKHIEHSTLRPTLLKQWCDNEAAVDKSNKEWIGPSEMLKPDMDVILAIHHTKRTIESHTTIICRHIYGHQDTRTIYTNNPSHASDASVSTTSSSSSTYSTHQNQANSADTNHANPEHQMKPAAEPSTTRPKLSLPARLNVECDRLATVAVTEAANSLSGTQPNQTIITPPYTGSRAILRIRDRWITSHQKRHVLKAHWISAIRDYCCRKYNWTQDVFDSVSWSSVQTVRKRLTPTQQMQTSKIMHEWLPTMHMEAHKTGNSHCPGCVCPDETLEHMLRCPNKTLAKERDILLIALRTKGLKIGIPRVIMEAFSKLLYEYVNAKQISIPDHPGIAQAVEAQKKIGIKLLPRGFLATQWITVLEEFSVDKPAQKIASLLKSIWIDFTDKLWRNRNQVAHQKGNRTTQVKARSWADKLTWFLDNPHVIARTDQFLLTFKRDDIESMTPQTRRRIAQQLETVQKAFALEKLHRQNGQSVISDFFKPRPKSNTTITTEITN